MKVIMDADCLIKLTKAGLKEDICRAFDVTLPHLVKKEVVDRGKARQLPDAFVVEKSLNEGMIKAKSDKSVKAAAGEKEAFTLYQKGGFDAIGSDDKRFIRQLELFNVPYVSPAVFIALMATQGIVPVAEALKKLDALSAYISDDEYSTAKLFLADRRLP
jgi:hypothetical protein